MAEDVKEKMDTFTTALSRLHATWSNRFTLYEQNVDIRMFKRDADQLEQWIEDSLATLSDKNLGDSISRTCCCKPEQLPRLTCFSFAQTRKS